MCPPRPRLLAVLFLTMALRAEDQPVPFREDFSSLDAWEALTFPEIDRHTRYSIVSEDGNSMLKAEADASASGLLSKTAFDPYLTPVLRWRWRVEDTLEKGNAEHKDGDDYPLRVYVLFDYDPQRASFAMRAKYALARRIHGEYPPHAALNYIWANRPHARRILPSPYTDRSQLVIVQAGTTGTGEWHEEQVNILSDYREAFGEDPPDKAHLAIMSDADNTGESAVGFIDYIEIMQDPSEPARGDENEPLNSEP